MCKHEILYSTDPSLQAHILNACLYAILGSCGRMVHELHFTSNDPILAKDASKKADDWYDIYDPRNEMNKRRRESDSRRGKAARRTDHQRRTQV